MCMACTQYRLQMADNGSIIKKVIKAYVSELVLFQVCLPVDLQEAAYDVMFLLLIEQPPLLLFYILFPSPSDLLLPLLLSLVVIVVVDACVRCRFSCIPGHLSGSLQSFFSSVTTRQRAAPTEHCKTLSSADKRVGQSASTTVIETTPVFINCVVPWLHESLISQWRPCGAAYAWRLIGGDFLSCSEVTDRHFKPVSSSAGPEEHPDFTTVHRPSIQGAWSCRKREREREGEKINTA
ncbi:hypothetical protein ABVT39_020971 [Epinephelus coioides]